MYYYWCTQRPAGPGAMPRGVVTIENLDPDKVIPEIGKGAYSLAGYDRELTAHEVYEYELTPCETLNGGINHVEQTVG